MINDNKILENIEEIDLQGSITVNGQKKMDKNKKYTYMKIRPTYMYLGGCMRWIGSKDDWYESETISKKYRNWEYKGKDLFNLDGSYRGFGVHDIGYIRGTMNQFNGCCEADALKHIDNYYSMFESFLKDKDVMDIAIEYPKKYNGRVFRVEDPILMANRFMIGGQFNLIEKAKLMKGFIEIYGLRIDDAIIYFQFCKY